MTTYVQYIIHVDKTNIDYSSKGSKQRDSQLEITLNNKNYKNYNTKINNKINNTDI